MQLVRGVAQRRGTHSAARVLAEAAPQPAMHMYPTPSQPPLLTDGGKDQCGGDLGGGAPNVGGLVAQHLVWGGAGRVGHKGGATCAASCSAPESQPGLSMWLHCPCIPLHLHHSSTGRLAGQARRTCRRLRPNSSDTCLPSPQVGLLLLVKASAETSAVLPVPVPPEAGDGAAPEVRQAAASVCKWPALQQPNDGWSHTGPASHLQNRAALAPICQGIMHPHLCPPAGAACSLPPPRGWSGRWPPNQPTTLCRKRGRKRRHC